MWNSQFPVNYHHWPGNWSYYLFGWVPRIWAKPTVKAKESYQGGGTKSTKQWWKNTKDGGWALAPFCHLFCSREQFFLRDKPTPTHFPQILDLSPPRAVQLGMQRGNPCSTPVDVLRRQHALGQCKEGVKLSSKWDSVISQPLESQHLLSFDDQIQGIFNRMCQ